MSELIRTSPSSLVSGIVQNRGFLFESLPESYLDKVSRYMDENCLFSQILDPFEIKEKNKIKYEHGQDILFFYRGADYILREHGYWNHEYGSGGSSRRENCLFKGGKPFLLSLAAFVWNTLSDDSTDYETGSQKETYLLENDALGRQIMEELKK